jgi:arylsulfatase A-like enzyme
MQLASEITRVPLLIRSPGIEAGRYEGVTRSIDVLPTLLNLSNLPPPEGIDLAGVDLSPAMAGEAPAPDLLAYSHSSVLVRSVFERMYSEERAADWANLRRYFPSEDPGLIWASVRSGDRLYRLSGRGGRDWKVSAFQLESDPEEKNDRFDPDSPEDAAIARQLAEYREHMIRVYRELGDRGSERLLPASDEVEALRGMGYIE